MCNFTDKDVAILEKWGNKKAKDYWMSDWNKTLYPIPEKSNAVRMKEFLKLKYENKRFMDKALAESLENGSSPSTIKHKKKKKVDSEDEKAESDSDGDAIEKTKYVKKKMHKLSKPEEV